MKRYRNLLFIIIAFFVGVFATLSTGLTFAHGGDTSLIHGCIRNNGLLSGFIRIVGANTNCNGNETALDWKQGLNEPPFTCLNCDLTQSSSKFTGKNLTNSFLPLTNFSGVNLTNTIFVNAYLIGAVFADSNLSNTNYTNADMQDIHANTTNFLNSNLTNVNFRGATLEGATNMNTATLTGVTWSNTTCPDGTNSDNNGNTCIGHLTP